MFAPVVAVEDVDGTGQMKELNRNLVIGHSWNIFCTCNLGKTATIRLQRLALRTISVTMRHNCRGYAELGKHPDA